MTATDTTALTVTETAQGLRLLADFLEQHPEVGEEMAAKLTNQDLLFPVSHVDDSKAWLGAFARAGKAFGITPEKGYDDEWGSVTLRFGPIKAWAYASREQVCERIVVGTETVTEQVPDPDALKAVPTVEVTREVEQVEWRCLPLLDGEAVSA